MARGGRERTSSGRPCAVHPRPRHAPPTPPSQLQQQQQQRQSSASHVSSSSSPQPHHLRATRSPSKTMRSSSSASPPDRPHQWPLPSAQTHCVASSTLHDDVPRASPDAATADARDSAGDPRDRAHGSPTSAAATKSVTWSTITVHEFGVGLGGSAIATRGGPPIGLAEAPEFTWTTNVGEMAECSEGVHRFSPSQRTRLLQAAGVPDNLITRHAREATIILSSRRRSKVRSDERTGAHEAEQERKDDDETARERSVVCKRRAEQADLEGPCVVHLQRLRMISVNYA